MNELNCAKSRKSWLRTFPVFLHLKGKFIILKRLPYLATCEERSVAIMETQNLKGISKSEKKHIIIKRNMNLIFEVFQFFHEILLN